MEIKPAGCLVTAEPLKVTAVPLTVTNQRQWPI